MRALQLVSDREVKTVDLAEPGAPAPGEVTLKVRVVALNHLDVWGWRGMAFAKREMPLTIGAEASAEVVALGNDLVGVRRGGLVVVVNATMQPVAVDLEHPELSIARPVFSSEPNEMHTPGVIPANSTVWFAS